MVEHQEIKGMLGNLFKHNFILYQKNLNLGRYFDIFRYEKNFVDRRYG